MIFKEDIFATPKLLTKLLNEDKKKTDLEIMGAKFQIFLP